MAASLTLTLVWGYGYGKTYRQRRPLRPARLADAAHHRLGDGAVPVASGVFLLTHSRCNTPTGTLSSPAGRYASAPSCSCSPCSCHTWVGVRDILMDYLKPVFLRLAMEVLTILALIAYAAWSIQIAVGHQIGNNMIPKRTFDAVIIGGGGCRIKSALQLAEANLKVAVVSKVFPTAPTPSRRRAASPPRSAMSPRTIGTGTCTTR